MNSESRNTDGQDGIRRRRISVVSSFCSIAPSWALYLSIKLVQVLDCTNLFRVDVSVLQHLFCVSVRLLVSPYSTSYRAVADYLSKSFFMFAPMALE